MRKIKTLEMSRGAVAELTARRAAVAEARADKDELRAALKVMKEEVDLLRLQVRACGACVGGVHLLAPTGPYSSASCSCGVQPATLPCSLQHALVLEARNEELLPGP